MGICQKCGNLFESYKKDKKYCGLSCAIEDRKAIAQKERVNVECLTCGKMVSIAPSHCKDGRRKYCSVSCRYEAQKKVKGSAHPMYGRKHSQETKEKIKNNRTVLKMDKHPSWRGGKWKNKGGYISLRETILTKEQMDIAESMICKQQHVLEHRLVMAMALGRPLKNTEIVHHLNGIKDDNRIENLALFENSKHSHEHRKVERENSMLKNQIEKLKKQIEELTSQLNFKDLPN